MHHWCWIKFSSLQGDTCCWVCDNCEEYEYVYDENTCRDCGPGRWPHEDKLSCFDLEIQYMRWETIFALIPLTFSCIGIIMTFIVIGLFLKNHDTPLVRASGRELSYMLLLGILLCYCNTFVLLAKPTLGTCVIQRFGVGVGFSIIYGALLTKTNRIARIFLSASKTAKRPSYISPRSQVVITISLIGKFVWILYERQYEHYMGGRRRKNIFPLFIIYVAWNVKEKVCLYSKEEKHDKQTVLGHQLDWKSISSDFIDWTFNCSCIIQSKTVSVQVFVIFTDRSKKIFKALWIWFFRV